MTEAGTFGGPSSAAAMTALTAGTATSPTTQTRRGARSWVMPRTSRRSPASPSTTRVITSAGNNRPMTVAALMNHWSGMRRSVIRGRNASSCPTVKNHRKKAPSGCRRMNAAGSTRALSTVPPSSCRSGVLVLTPGAYDGGGWNADRNAANTGWSRSQSLARAWKLRAKP
jgi:hypothetical protein